LVRSDPTRIIQVVITGVSFLGAGTIPSRSATRQAGGGSSLPPWESTWRSRSLVLAVGMTALVLVTLRGLGFVEHWPGQREND